MDVPHGDPGTQESRCLGSVASLTAYIWDWGGRFCLLNLFVKGLDRQIDSLCNLVKKRNTERNIHNGQILSSRVHTAVAVVGGGESLRLVCELVV